MKESRAVSLSKTHIKGLFPKPTNGVDCSICIREHTSTNSKGQVFKKCILGNGMNNARKEGCEDYLPTELYIPTPNYG